MSATFREVSLSLDKLRTIVQHNDRNQAFGAYHSINTSVESSRELYLQRIDVCEEYLKGFSQEKLTNSLPAVVSFLREMEAGIKTGFLEIVGAKIPVEAYFLVQYFHDLTKSKNRFVLAEGRAFESGSVYEEVRTELSDLPVPLPQGTQAETLLLGIKNEDFLKIYYEALMFDSPLTWPLFLHEVFHHTYETDKLEEVLQVHKVQNEIGAADGDWVKETVIDLLACALFGPSYSVSLSEYHEGFPGGGTISHPSHSARLYGLLQFLGDIYKRKNETSSIVGDIIEESFKIVESHWVGHRREKEELQKQVKVVYERAYPLIQEYFRRMKLTTFIASVADGKDAQEFALTTKYITYGIPRATDPRILFNSLVIQKESVSPHYVAECLKKWYLQEKWQSVVNQTNLAKSPIVPRSSSS